MAESLLAIQANLRRKAVTAVDPVCSEHTHSSCTLYWGGKVKDTQRTSEGEPARAEDQEGIVWRERGYVYSSMYSLRDIVLCAKKTCCSPRSISGHIPASVCDSFCSRLPPVRPDITTCIHRSTGRVSHPTRSCLCGQTLRETAPLRPHCAVLQQRTSHSCTHTHTAHTSLRAPQSAKQTRKDGWCLPLLLLK